VRLRRATHRNIYVRSRRADERVMASMSRFLTRKLRLKVNEAKNAVARLEEHKFLGFSISNGGSERRIAPKALDKFKTQVRETRRTRGISLQQLIEHLTPYLIGWRGYRRPARFPCRTTHPRYAGIRSLPRCCPAAVASKTQVGSLSAAIAAGVAAEARDIAEAACCAGRRGRAHRKLAPRTGTPPRSGCTDAAPLRG
jgi:group II intron maturase